MRVCTMKDVTISYSPCEEGKRKKEYLLLQPQLCTLPKDLFEDNNKSVTCPICPEGFTREHESDVCLPCPIGLMLKKGKCEKIPAGKYGKYRIVYFSNNHTVDTAGMVDNATSLPVGFATYCTGRCGSGKHNLSLSLTSLSLSPPFFLSPSFSFFSFPLVLRFPFFLFPFSFS
jgi:hypothetical protein